MANIVLLTGERQVGKTTVCLRLLEIAQARGIEVGGLITKHTGPHELLAVDVRDGTEYPLTLPFSSEDNPLLHFRMSPEAMSRTARVLSCAFPTQLFILDEIGPLELLHGRGWVEGIRLLAQAHYDVAVLVVRPELLETAIAQLPPLDFFLVSRVTEARRDLLPRTLWQFVERCFLAREVKR